MTFEEQPFGSFTFNIFRLLSVQSDLTKGNFHLGSNLSSAQSHQKKQSGCKELWWWWWCFRVSQDTADPMPDPQSIHPPHSSTKKPIHVAFIAAALMCSLLLCWLDAATLSAKSLSCFRADFSIPRQSSAMVLHMCLHPLILVGRGDQRLLKFLGFRHLEEGSNRWWLSQVLTTMKMLMMRLSLVAAS